MASPSASYPTSNGTHYPASDGHSIGPYLLSKNLGKGSFAVVKIGIHRTTGAHVALKMIKKSHAKDHPDLLDQIQREVAVLRQLDHPNVTRIVDFFSNPTHLVVAMEFVSGGNLLRFLKKGGFEKGLPRPLAFHIFHEVVCGLEYCHSVGVLHRDIRLENILIDEQLNLVKLSDFGLASAIKIDSLKEVSPGSFHYVAPELILRTTGYTQASDIWSLGIVLFVICEGSFPFHDRDFRSLAYLICQGNIVMPEPFDADLQDVIRRLLCLSSTERISLSGLQCHSWWRSNFVSYPSSANKSSWPPPPPQLPPPLLPPMGRPSVDPKPRTVAPGTSNWGYGNGSVREESEREKLQRLANAPGPLGSPDMVRSMIQALQQDFREKRHPR